MNMQLHVRADGHMDEVNGPIHRKKVPALRFKQHQHSGEAEYS